MWKQRRLWNVQAAIRSLLGLLLPAAPQHSHLDRHIHNQAHYQRQYHFLIFLNCTTVQCGFRLRRALLQVRSVFDLSFQFVILYLLIPVRTQFHHLFFGRTLSRHPRILSLNTWYTFLLLSIHSPATLFKITKYSSAFLSLLRPVSYELLQPYETSNSLFYVF